MADNAESPSDAQVTFKVKTSGDRNHTITMAETASVLDLKTKLAGSEFEDIPIERQRLIYSGRVMKNEEPLSTYKIKSGNTVPTNMAAGTANNPLAGLTGARYAGLTGLPSADMFGPDGGMVGSMMDEEQMANMLSNPNVAQQMNEMMNNDQFLDMMIQQNPMLRNNPNAREILRSPMFRHMMTNPDALRSAARMQRALQGQRDGASAFPAPGVTDNTPGSNEGGAAGAGANNNAAGQPNPFDPMSWAGLGVPGGQGQGGGADASNPFAALLGAGNPFMGMGAPPGQQPAAGATGGAGDAATTGAQAQSGDANSGAAAGGAAGSNPAAANPFAALFGGMPGAMGAGAGAGAGATNPYGLPPGMPPISNEALMQMMQTMGMGSPGGGGSPAPADNRPPEERYADQLRQLNDMGFYDFDRNIAALRRSGGSVQGAVEHLLSS
ncbi:hypothetical protein PG988_001915 [Apiospora saccharicola]